MRVFVGIEPFGRSAQHLILGVSEDGRRTLIPVADPAAKIGVDDAVADGVEEMGKELQLPGVAGALPPGVAREPEPISQAALEPLAQV